MRSRFLSQYLVYLFIFFFSGALLLVNSNKATAQFEDKWLSVGSYENYYRSAGGESAAKKTNFWPAIYRRQYNGRGNATWIAAKNFTDERGEEFAHKVVHAGPRVTGQGEMFPMQFEMISRFEPPTVTVDGFETFKRPTFNDEVDPSLKADRMIHSVVNTQLGITLERNIRQFSQQHHNNYHVLEFVLTNTGNVDGDEEIELPEQTVEGVYLSFQRRYEIAGGSGGNIPGQEWGAHVVHDVVGDGMEDYETDLRAIYTWAGNSPGADIDPYGGPVREARWFMQEADTVGRLAAQTFLGHAELHVDKSADDSTDDPGQPSTTAYITGDHPVTAGNDPYNKPLMNKEYDWIAKGHMYPHHADVIDQDNNFLTPDGRPKMGTAGGMKPLWSYGPYTLKPGESVRIVFAEGAAGLSRPAALEIGRQWKKAGWDGDAPISYQGQTMTKNEWYFTGRDSLTQTFERALANYQSGWNLPRAPKPPRTFNVNSGVDAITLEWTTYEGENPAGGFEIYRTQNAYEGDVDNDFKYEKIYTAAADERSYQDTDITRGINYFYYIQAVGADRPEDPSTMTPEGPLKSSRYYTQTYSPASLKRKPGNTLGSVRVVPNPYHLGSDENVRWPGVQDQIGFLEVPGKCTIQIYTENGELIETLEHTDGSGDEYWNLTTNSNQLIASGVYVAVIQDEETGDQITRNFIVIR